MKRNLSTVIVGAERSPLPWGCWLATFLAIVLARNLLEGALGPAGSIGFVYFSSPSALMVLDHFLLFYVSLFLAFSVVLSALARESIGRVMKIVTPAWALILVPPLLDYVLTSGEGIKLAYVLNPGAVLLKFFDPRASLEAVSPGQRVEILGACVLASAYVRLKTKHWGRTIAAFVAIYAVIVAHGALPSAFARLSQLVAGATEASAEFSYRVAFKSGGIVADESRKLALLFFFTSTLLGWLAFRLHSADKERAMRANVRPLRSLHYVGMTAFGVAFGWALFSPSGVQFAGAGDALGVAASLVATFLAFQASVSVNDVFDEETDRAAGAARPLVVGTLARRDVVARAVALGLGALLLALNIKYSTFLLMLLALSVALLYSAPPLRLKRFPVVSTLSLGIVSLLACLVGFSVFAEERALALFPARLGWLVVLSFGLGFVAKDLKDVEGDRATGVMTLPVLLGPKAGRTAVATLVFAGYAMVALLLPYRALVVPAIVIGVGNALLIHLSRAPRLDRILLAFSLVLTLALAVFVLRNIEPLLEVPRPIAEAKAAELRGRRAEAWSDWTTASEGYAVAAAVLTDDPDVQLRAGATHFEGGRFEQALPFLAAAADLDPSSPIALEYLAKTEAQLGRSDVAEWLMRWALRECVRPGVFSAALGEHYIEAGRADAAEQAFARALRLGRPDIPARVRLADAMFAQGRTEDARAEYETAVGRRPSSAEARGALGRFLSVMGDLERSIKELRLAVNLDPESEVHWNNLGAAYRMARRYDESLDALATATSLAPGAPDPYYNRGLVFDALSRTSEARRQYLLALEADPGFTPARQALRTRNSP